MFSVFINRLISYIITFIQNVKQVFDILINDIIKYFDVIVINSDLIRKSAENSICQTMLYNYFEKTSIDVILITVAVGLETCFITLLIFIIQQTSKSGNKIYKICNISNTIFSYTSFKLFTLFNIALIVIIIFGKIFLPYIYGCNLLIYLFVIWFLFIVLIYNFCKLINKIKNIIDDNINWLNYIYNFYFEIISKFCEEHKKLTNKIEKNIVPLNKRIKNLNLKTKINFLDYKIKKDADNNNLFCICAKDGILSDVKVEKINEIIQSLNLGDDFVVKVRCDISSGLTTNDILLLILIKSNIEVNIDKILNIIDKKRKELLNCFVIEHIEKYSALYAFYYIYYKKRFSIENVSKNDTFQFNWLLNYTIYDLFEKIIKNDENIYNVSDFLKTFFYNFTLFSYTDSVYSFSHHCNFIIEALENDYNFVKELCENIYIERMVEIFNIIKRRSNFIDCFCRVLVHLIHKFSTNRKILDMILRCKFSIYDVGYVNCNEKCNDNVDYDIIKFHFNIIMLYYLDKYRNVWSKNKNKKDRFDDITKTIDEYIKQQTDEFFKHYSIFDVLPILNKNSIIIDDFVYLNFGFDQSNALYNLIYVYIKLCKPDLTYDDDYINSHFDDFKIYRFQLIYRYVENSNEINEIYKHDVKDFFSKLMKLQFESKYVQKYIDNFNNNFARNLKEKSNITLMHIYLKILQNYNSINFADDINNVIIIPYNKNIYKDLYSDNNIWSFSECSSVSYAICYDIDKQLLDYYKKYAIEILEKINVNDYVAIATFAAEGDIRYRVDEKDLIIDNNYYKYLYIKKDSLPELLWPNNAKFDLNLDDHIDNAIIEKAKIINRKIDHYNKGKIVLYNAPVLQFKEKPVIIKSKVLLK